MNELRNKNKETIIKEKKNGRFFAYNPGGMFFWSWSSVAEKENGIRNALSMKFGFLAWKSNLLNSGVLISLYRGILISTLPPLLYRIFLVSAANLIFW